ncbi:carbohydrate ABC transporter permease [Paenibacillus puerhi]|uniref:carbohydrate ABC transporter permease n=1 Tax=Paenibacillus puerhi TaxID=2692622 RepID=UPI001F202B6E|nr:carbohydrate ABC transporter permease [Paenibacillus puerhi]
MRIQKAVLGVIRYTWMLILAFAFLFPMIWMIVSTFKNDLQIFGDMRSIHAFLPPIETEGSYFRNYVKAMNTVPLFRYTLNTLFYCSAIVLTGIIVNSMAGYALARMKFPLKNVIFTLVLSLIILPQETIFLPLYTIIHKLGWINSYWGLILPFIAAPLFIFLFRQFFLGIPAEVEESAKLDGATIWRTYFQIVMPLAKPVFATVAILQFTQHWTEYLWPSMVITDNNMRTIQIGINYFFNLPNPQWGPILAAITIATIPMVIIFASFQKYYVQGLAHTGSKE